MSLTTRLLPAILLASLAACGRGTPRPNVLLVSIDSLRADHLSCYGYERPTSPAIDRLASEGTLFERAFSTTSWTLPAHASLFTALPESVHGCNLARHRLAEGHTTLAEALEGVGYETVGFWSGPFLDPRYGLGQGFERYVDCTGYGSEEHAKGAAHAWSHADVTGPRLVEAFRGWLGERSERPFFAFLHFWDVHYDYIPPPPYDTMFGEAPEKLGRNLGTIAARGTAEGLREGDLEALLRLYDGEIAWTDHNLRLALDELEARGLLENTIVVVTADHGEEFFEHGRFGHRKELFDESVHVPLIVRFPPSVPVGRVGRPVSLLDVAPTLLELVGAPPLGHTLGSSLFGERDVVPETVLSELALQGDGGTKTALRSEAWKVVRERGGGDVTHTYWDLRSDPGEVQPVPEERIPAAARDTFDRMLELLEGLRALHEAGAAGAEAAVDDELMEQLKRLGYADSE